MSLVASFFTRIVWPKDPPSIARAAVLSADAALIQVIVTYWPGLASGTASTIRPSPPSRA